MIETFTSKLTLDRLNFRDVRVALDVGSRDGLQSIELANAFPHARVVAIEGNPDTMPDLLKNIAAHPRVSAVETLVNDYNGETTFYQIDREKTVTPHKDGNPGASSLFVADQSYPAETYVQKSITRPCKTLDQICDELGLDTVDIIWMDLQGAEIKAFSGFLGRLARVRYINVEVTHKSLYVGQPLFAEFEAFMDQHGFDRISRVDLNSYFEDAVYRNRRFHAQTDNDVTIQQTWGGLGDNLQLTTLPRLYAAAGRSVYLSRDNVCRNTDIEDVVWGMNPFVKGISVAPPNAGQAPIEQHIQGLDIGLPFMHRVEAVHGLPGVSLTPELYRPCRFLPELEGLTLIDLSSTSVFGGNEKLQNYMRHVVNQHKVGLGSSRQVKFKNFHPTSGVHFNDLPSIECENLAHYCDMLYSCSVFVTVHSGAQSLAAAIRSLPGSRLRKMYCYATPHQFNTRIFIYPGVEYHVE
jgi:FkbM family methyltransferase